MLRSVAGWMVLAWMLAGCSIWPGVQSEEQCTLGSLRQLDPRMTAGRPLTLLAYDIVGADGAVPDTQWETLHFLDHLGFRVSRCTARFETLGDVADYCQDWIQRRDAVAYEVDGLVIKVDHLATQTAMGVVGRAPRGAGEETGSRAGGSPPWQTALAPRSRDRPEHHGAGRNTVAPAGTPRRRPEHRGVDQDVTAHCPRFSLTGPLPFGRTSKSKISVGR